MRAFFFKILMVSAAFALLAAQWSALPAQEELKKESVKGTLIRIDEETGSVFIMSESRMLRFRCDNSLCSSMKSSVSRTIAVIFTRSSNDELTVISFTIDGTEG